MGDRLTGRVYLLIERTGRGGKTLRVSSHRMTKPTQGAAEGVWVDVGLDVPESVFGPYEATLSLPENDLRGTVVVARGDSDHEVIGEPESESEDD